MQDDFLPTASLNSLKQRAQLLQQIRRFFDEQDFFEVETPLLSHDTCIDRHLHPIKVPAENVLRGDSAANLAASQNSNVLWLQTSPEFGMKRLLAAGARAIYQITKVFRGGELGRRHNPEFTMLEWYRVGDNLDSGMTLLAEFASKLLGRSEIVRIGYRELFQQALGIDPHKASIGDLRWCCRQRCIGLSADSFSEQDRDFWLNLLLSQVIEPQLGFETPIIVYDWPATQSALAKVRNDDPPVAERFELFVNGVELANGYHELLDVQELRSRNRRQNNLRVADGYDALPEESRLLAAMQAGIPACAGVALGVDRLAMVMAEATCIDEVIAFPFDRA
jgi:lysyl-tRNA synthetase class 2